MQQGVSLKLGATQ